MNNKLSAGRTATMRRRRAAGGALRGASPRTRSLAIAASLLALLPPLLVMAAGTDHEEASASVERRLAHASRLLSSDEFEGRGIGTRGLDQAAELIADEFRQIGLKTELYEQTPFQRFTVVRDARPGDKNELAFLFVGPANDGADEDAQTRDDGAGEQDGANKLKLSLGEDFNPLAIGSSGTLDVPLVFVGYGITADELDYDDYTGVDANGKAVIVLRHEPQQNNPHSKFDGTEHSEHAPFRRKLSNALDHGAAAVIFCTSQPEIERRVQQYYRRWQAALEELDKADKKFRQIANPTRDQIESHRQEIETLAKRVVRFGEQLRQEYDPVLSFEGAGSSSTEPGIPVLHARRAVIDRLLKAAGGKDLATLEGEIDQGPTPQSFALDGWRCRGTITVDREKVAVKNVVAVLEGEGPHADETIVIGAHYDHLGHGGRGSAAPGSTAIHNGADDNASGAAVLLQVARRLANRSGKLPRRVVFIAFTGEERGLLGSAEYVRHPLFPLEKTVAMLNMDMVGRLRDDKLIVNGTGTAAEFPAWLDEINERDGFHLVKSPSGFGPSDHTSFYAKKIPVLHFFTGEHADYHKPTDDFEYLNVPGMRRVGELVADMAVRIAESPDPPTYQATKSSSPDRQRAGDRPYFGSIPAFGEQVEGYPLSGVAPESPAARAGVQAGDVIIRFGKHKITSLEDFDSALRRFKTGDKVAVIVRRDGKEVALNVILDPPR